MERPASPTNSFQPRASPASTETRALTAGGQDSLAVGGVLLVEPLHARHGHHAGGDALGLERFAGLDGELDLGAGGDQDDLAVRSAALGRFGQDVAAPGHARGGSEGVAVGLASPRAKVGTFWRVRTMPAGFSWFSRMVFHAMPTSLASPGGPRPGPGSPAGWRAAPPAGGWGRLRPGRWNRATTRRWTELPSARRGGWPAAGSR